MEGHPDACHPGAGMGPELGEIIENIRIPASAGMTACVHRTYVTNF
jgi:hypothetical protein